MAFENYTTLKSDIADWLNREDLTDKIPAFIRLFEARANRVLRTHDMVKRSTALTDNGYFSVPAEWLETIALMLTSGSPPRPLEFVSIENSFALRAQARSGLPTHYTHMDGKFFLIPAPTTETNLELIYRGAVPPLTAEAPVNWLLTRSPDLYLFGALSEAEPYLKNDERVALWQAKTAQVLGDMAYEAERAAYPQGALKMKARTFG
jgi:hypothetical protein